MLDRKLEERNKLIREIQDFFINEREESLGILAAGDLLDFFDSLVGKARYNEALDDARKWFAMRMEDLEYDFDSLYRG